MPPSSADPNVERPTRSFLSEEDWALLEPKIRSKLIWLASKYSDVPAADIDDLTNEVYLYVCSGDRLRNFDPARGTLGKYVLDSLLPNAIRPHRRRVRAERGVASVTLIDVERHPTPPPLVPKIDDDIAAVAATGYAEGLRAVQRLAKRRNGNSLVGAVIEPQVELLVSLSGGADAADTLRQFRHMAGLRRTLQDRGLNATDLSRKTVYRTALRFSYSRHASYVDPSYEKLFWCTVVRVAAAGGVTLDDLVEAHLAPPDIDPEDC